MSSGSTSSHCGVTVGIDLRQLDPPAFVYANPAYVQIVGADPTLADHDSSDNPALVLIRRDDYDRVMTDYWPRAQQGLFADTEHRVVRPHGVVRWVHTTRSPVMNDDGKVTNVAGTVEDITTRKTAEAAPAPSASMRCGPIAPRTNSCLE